MQDQCPHGIPTTRPCLDCDDHPLEAALSGEESVRSSAVVGDWQRRYSEAMTRTAQLRAEIKPLEEELKLVREERMTALREIRAGGVTRTNAKP